MVMPRIYNPSVPMYTHGNESSTLSPAVKLFKEQKPRGAFDALQCGKVTERSLAVGSMDRGVALHRGHPPYNPGLGMRIKLGRTQNQNYPFCVS